VNIRRKKSQVHRRSLDVDAPAMMWQITKLFRDGDGKRWAVDGRIQRIARPIVDAWKSMPSCIGIAPPKDSITTR
jgi:hypothetical protein